ncbi:hypothetical protein WN51_09914 [Melipona quadrifasciata]|uniref:Uncharacterized protein n=1 Tax=Melipona quadrifasciata TaxID=166423 RepID=A0A0N0BJF3_9HYME|nr:hypothetical protein WN51_09914 [Melipona quadrifasciata]
MFVAQCKNIIESEESSDEEVVSFTRIINRISSNSDSDDEESYASEDLEEMLEELAIVEEEELTNAGDSLDNIQYLGDGRACVLRLVYKKLNDKDLRFAQIIIPRCKPTKTIRGRNMESIAAFCDFVDVLILR